MNSVLEQAVALQRFLDGGVEYSSVSNDLFESMLACCVGLMETGQAAVALGLIEKSEQLVSERSPEDQVRLNTMKLRVSFMMHANPEMLDLARESIRLAQDAGLQTELAIARVYRGMALWRLNRAQESIRELEALREELLRQPESLALAMCVSTLASAYNTAGDWAQGRRFAIEAVVSASRIGSPHWEAVSYVSLAWAQRGLCRWAESVESGGHAFERFSTVGNEYQLCHAEQILAIVEWKRGRLERASELVTSGLARATAIGVSVRADYFRMLQGLIAAHIGDFASAKSQLTSLDLTLVAESRPSLLRHEYLGDLLLEQGKYAEALAMYDEVWPKAMALVPRGDIVAELRRRKAECHLALGRPQRAYEDAKEAIAHCLEISDRYEEACTYRTLALSAAALGKADEARKQFEHGFAMFDDIETPYEWGKLWVAYGDWLCGAHADRYRDLNGAHEAYRAAIDHFEHMGAEYKLAETRARLEQLGHLMSEESAALAPADRKARPLRRPRWSADLQRRSQWAFDTFGMITRDRSLLEMLEEIANVAKSDLPVLVLGESGTGKELIARGVHDLSGRTGQFVAVNCSAIPATMLEDEFFGHVHGAFTSAAGEKQGLLELAHDGSVFMDEVGEMSLDLQAKLLRFLETNEFRRIGGTKPIHVNTRIVAATNRDRERMQSGDGFRSDLYYRLAHAVYTLSPLRQRGDDVELLVEHFLDLFCEQHHKRVTLSTAARARLLSNHWPGNIRQLRAVMQKIVISAPQDHVITPRELPMSEAEAGPKGLDQELMDQERRRIVDALERAQYVKADAARLLRMSRTSMLAKMKRLGIPG